MTALKLSIARVGDEYSPLIGAQVRDALNEHLSATTLAPDEFLLASDWVVALIDQILDPLLLPINAEGGLSWFEALGLDATKCRARLTSFATEESFG